MKNIRILCALILVMVLLAGCGSSGNSNSNSNSDNVKRFDPKAVISEITLNSGKPVVGETAKLTIKVTSEDFENVLPIRGGMRVELRDNSRSTRIFDAVDISTEDTTLFEADVVFEQDGENTVYLHYNVNTVHIMQKKTIEVDPS